MVYDQRYHILNFKEDLMDKLLSISKQEQCSCVIHLGQGQNDRNKNNAHQFSHKISVCFLVVTCISV